MNPTTIPRGKRGDTAQISYSGDYTDAMSGYYSVTTILTDEYGVYNQNFGSANPATVIVEAWCEPNDSNGRTYTFRMTARDVAGNQGFDEKVTTVPRR